LSIDAETSLNLDQDQVAVADFLEDNGGHLDHDEAEPGVYWMTTRPRAAPDEKFFVRVGWDSYPQMPPSVKFGDAVGGSLTVTNAWPVITGYRPGSFDICRPMSKEGYEAHAEWREGSTAWVSDGNPFLWVAETMQFHMDNEYQGRTE
jgi:hypothetical protein